jgi:hypothetical protein
MARWLLTFGVLVAVGSFVSPWLRQIGLGGLPGDMVVDLVPGFTFHLPISSALLVSALVAGTWSLLDR